MYNCLGHSVVDDVNYVVLCEVLCSHNLLPYTYVYSVSIDQSLQRVFSGDQTIVPDIMFSLIHSDHVHIMSFTNNPHVRILNTRLCPTASYNQQLAPCTAHLFLRVLSQSIHLLSNKIPDQLQFGVKGHHLYSYGNDL